MSLGPTSMIEELPQWGLWTCRYHGRVSYHPDEQSALDQLDLFRDEEQNKRWQDDKES